MSDYLPRPSSKLPEIFATPESRAAEALGIASSMGRCFIPELNVEVTRDRARGVWWVSAQGPFTTRGALSALQDALSEALFNGTPS